MITIDSITNENNKKHKLNQNGTKINVVANIKNYRNVYVKTYGM